MIVVVPTVCVCGGGGLGWGSLVLGALSSLAIVMLRKIELDAFRPLVKNA